jgi:hypothetical protein
MAPDADWASMKAIVAVLARATAFLEWKTNGFVPPVDAAFLTEL